MTIFEGYLTYLFDTRHKTTCHKLHKSSKNGWVDGSEFIVTIAKASQGSQHSNDETAVTKIPSVFQRQMNGR